MSPEVYRIMKAALEGVKCRAEMMRSPSFSRSGESSTMMNSPLPGKRPGRCISHLSYYKECECKVLSPGAGCTE